jgi:hypothetical protein
VSGVTGRRRGERRRWPRILLILFGGLVVVAAGLLVALHLTSPPRLDVTQPGRPLPDDWLVAEEGPDAVSSEADPAAFEAPDSGFVTLGQLAFYGRGRPFGVERYEIRGDGDSVVLSSTGEFRFSAVVTTIRVGFEQRLETDARLAPTSYEATFDAPLGLGRKIETVIANGVARTTSAGEEAVSPVGADTVVLGTFGTYALLPLLFPERERDGFASFEVLFLGGPPNGEEDIATRVTVERVSPVGLLAEGLRIDADAYIVSSPFGETLLLAKGGELLALLAGGGRETLAVVRSDFFPDGFELVDPASLDRIGPLPSVIP